MTYMEQTKVSIYQKINNFKHNHLVRLAEKLAFEFIMKNGNKVADVTGFVSRCESSYDDNFIRNQIRQNWHEEDVEKAHNAITQMYRSGERYYKKGRPFGSKNRSREARDLREQWCSLYTDESGAIDALKELEDISYEEVKSETKTEVKTTDTKEFNTQHVRELIAEQMQEFIKAYGRDKNEMMNQLELHTGAILETLKHDIEQRFNELKPNLIELKKNEFETIQLGVQHKNFEKLLKICNATLRNGSHNNVWIYGPAGTGKSTAAENVAKALQLDYYTDGKLADETKVLGYQDAGGQYRTTNFRKAFEFGGVYLADEIDGSMPDALLALNGALANGHCSFPDKIVERHKDFIFIAAANTTGTGGTIEYVGRFKQDAAFNDRFVFLDWPLDENLEASLVANKEWLSRVRHVRAKIATSTIKGHLITPRASIYGESLLAAGLTLEEVECIVLKKGLTDAQWNMIK